MSASVNMKSQRHGAQYLKRAAQLIGSAAGSYFSDAMPVTSSVVKDSKELTHDVAAAFNESRSKIIPNVRKIKAQFGLKSISNWFLGESSDFDAEDPAAGLSFEGVENSAEIAEAEISESTKNTNKLAKAVIDSSHQMVNASAELTGTMLTSVEKTAEIISSGFNKTHELLSQILEVVTKNTASLVEANAAQVANEEDLAAGQKMINAGKFSLKDYRAAIRENIKEEFPEVDAALQMIPMIVDNIKDPEALSSMLFGSLFDKIAPNLSKNLSKLDESINEGIMNTITRLATDKTNGIAGTLSRIFGIKTGKDTSADTSRSKLELKQTPFDTVTKEAITNAIPGYLRQILVAVGGPELEYDYRSRAFRTRRAMQKDFQANTIGRGGTLGGSTDTMRKAMYDPALGSSGEMFFELMVNEMGRRGDYKNELDLLTDPVTMKKYLETLTANYDLGEAGKNIDKVAASMSDALKDQKTRERTFRQIDSARTNRLRQSKKYLQEADAYSVDMSGYTDNLDSSTEGIMANYKIQKKTGPEISNNQNNNFIRPMDYTNHALYEIYRRLDDGLNVFITGHSDKPRKKPYTKWGKRWLQPPGGYTPKEGGDSDDGGGNNSGIDMSHVFDGAKPDIPEQAEVRYDGEGGWLGDAAKYTGDKAKELGMAMLKGSPDDVSSVVSSIFDDIAIATGDKAKNGIKKVNDSFGNVTGHIKHQLFGTAYEYTDEDGKQVRVKESEGALGFLGNRIKESFVSMKDRGLQWAKDMAAKFDFGGSDGEEKGMAGKRKQFMGAAVGAMAGAGIIGGPLGILFGGIAGNALATHDIGSILKDKLFGYDDSEKGGGKPTGIISKLGEKILTPIEYTANKLVVKGAEFIDHHIFDPLTNIGVAIHDKITNSVDSIKDIVGGWLKEHVFSPIGQGVKFVAKWTVGLPITLAKLAKDKIPELFKDAKEALSKTWLGEKIGDAVAAVKNIAHKIAPRALFSRSIAGGNSYHKLSANEQAYPLKAGQKFYDPAAGEPNNPRARGHVRELTRSIAEENGREWVNLKESGVVPDTEIHHGKGVYLDGSRENEWRPRTKDYLAWRARQRAKERSQRYNIKKYSDFKQDRRARGRSFREGLRGATSETVDMSPVVESTEALNEKTSEIVAGVDKITGEIIPGKSFKTHDYGMHERLDTIIEIIRSGGIRYNIDTDFDLDDDDRDRSKNGSSVNEAGGGPIELIADKLAKNRNEDDTEDETFANHVIGAAATVAGSGGVFTREESQLTTDIVTESSKNKTSKSLVLGKFKSLLGIQEDKVEGTDSEKKESIWSKIFSFGSTIFGKIGDGIKGVVDFLTGGHGGLAGAVAGGVGLAIGAKDLISFYNEVIKGDKTFKEWFAETSTVGSAVVNLWDRFKGAIDEDGHFHFIDMFDKDSYFGKFFQWTSDKFTGLMDTIVDDDGRINFSNLTEEGTPIGDFINSLKGVANFLGTTTRSFASFGGTVVNKLIDVAVGAGISGLQGLEAPTEFDDGIAGGIGAGIMSNIYMSAISALGNLVSAVSNTLGSAGGGVGSFLGKVAPWAIGGIALGNVLADGGTLEHENTSAGGQEIIDIDKTRASYSVLNGVAQEGIKGFGNAVQGVAGRHVTSKLADAGIDATINAAGGVTFREAGKFASNAAVESATGMAKKDVTEAILKSVSNSSDDVAKSKGAMGFVKKALEGIKNFLMKNKTFAKFAKTISTKIDDILFKMSSAADGIIAKMPQKIANIITKGGTKDSAGALTAGIGYAVMAFGGALSGGLSAANIFGVRESDVNGTMRTIASVVVAMLNAVPGLWALELADLFIAPLTIRGLICTLLYNLLGGGDDLVEKQAVFAQDLALYNETYGAELSVDEYNDLTNKGMMAKIFGFGGVKTDEEGRAMFDEAGNVIRTNHGVAGWFAGGQKKYAHDAEGNLIRNEKGEALQARDKYGNKLVENKTWTNYVGDFFGGIGGWLGGRTEYEVDENGEAIYDENGNLIVKNKEGNVFQRAGASIADWWGGEVLKDEEGNPIKDESGNDVRQGGFKEWAGEVLGKAGSAIAAPFKAAGEGIHNWWSGEVETDELGNPIVDENNQPIRKGGFAKWAGNILGKVGSAIAAPYKAVGGAIHNWWSGEEELDEDGNPILDEQGNPIRKGGFADWAAGTLGKITGGIADVARGVKATASDWLFGEYELDEEGNPILDENKNPIRKGGFVKWAGGVLGGIGSAIAAPFKSAGSAIHNWWSGEIELDENGEPIVDEEGNPVRKGGFADWASGTLGKLTSGIGDIARGARAAISDVIFGTYELDEEGNPLLDENKNPIRKGGIAGFIRGGLGLLNKAIISPLSDAAHAAGEWLHKGVEWAKDGLKSAKDWIVDKASSMWNAISTPVGDFLKGAREWAHNTGAWIAEGASNAKDWIVQHASDAWTAISTPVGDFVNGAKEWLGDAASWLGDKAESAGAWIADKASSVWTTVTTPIVQLGEGVANWVSKKAQWVQDKAHDVGSWIGDKVSNIFGRITGTIGNIADGVKQWFEKSSDWAREGVRNVVDWVTKKVKSVWDWITNPLGQLANRGRQETQYQNYINEQRNSSTSTTTTTTYSSNPYRYGYSGGPAQDEMDRIDKLADNRMRTYDAGNARLSESKTSIENQKSIISTRNAVGGIGGPTTTIERDVKAGVLDPNELPLLERGVHGNPLNKGFKVSSGYGWRDLYGNGNYDDFHKGIDLVPDDNTGQAEIGSKYNGTVSAVDKSVADSHTGLGVSDHTAGNFVFLDTDPMPDGNRWRIKFMHMKHGSIPANIQEGARVSVDQKIGEMGSTGMSTGNHLHYQIEKVAGDDNTHTDPLPWITKDPNASSFTDRGAGYDSGSTATFANTETTEQKGWFAQIIDVLKDAGTKILDYFLGGLFSLGGNNSDNALLGYNGNYASAEAFLQMVAREIGNHDDGNNKVKYNDWFWGQGTCGPDYPWCMAFVQWCFHQAGLDLECKTAGCGTFLRYYQANYPEKVFKAGGNMMPQPGDIAIFAETAHTGIITGATDSSHIQTIEGNTSSTNNENGGWVERKNRETPYFDYFVRAIDFGALALSPSGDLSGADNEEKAWNFLLSRGYTPAQAAGVLANLKAESGLKPTNLGDPDEGRLGFTDESYTAAVDNGSYTNFVHDDAGYGLAQWTWFERKQNLLNYSKQRGVSIGDLGLQLAFLDDELGELGIRDKIMATNTYADATNVMLREYERPANMDFQQRHRTGFAKELYDKYAGGRGKIDPREEAAITKSINEKARINNRRTLRSDIASHTKKAHPSFKNKYIETFNEYLPSEELQPGGPRNYYDQGSTIKAPSGQDIFINHVEKHKPAGIGGMSDSDMARLRVPAKVPTNPSPINNAIQNMTRQAAAGNTSAYRNKTNAPINASTVVDSGNTVNNVIATGTDLSGVVALLKQAVTELAAINSNTSESATTLVEINDKEQIVVDKATSSTNDSVVRDRLGRATNRAEGVRRHISNGSNVRTISSLIKP